MNNRSDLGLISAFTADATAVVDALASEIFLNLDEMQDLKCWHYTPIEPTMLAAHYGFKAD